MVIFLILRNIIVNKGLIYVVSVSAMPAQWPQIGNDTLHFAYCRKHVIWDADCIKTTQDKMKGVRTCCLRCLTAKCIIHFKKRFHCCWSQFLLFHNFLKKSRIILSIVLTFILVTFESSIIKFGFQYFDNTWLTYLLSASSCLSTSNKTSSHWHHHWSIGYV